mgnify:CR=1 FL=1
MLQALMNYGNRLDSEPGFRTREVRWCVELAADGPVSYTHLTLPTSDLV